MVHRHVYEERAITEWSQVTEAVDALLRHVPGSRDWLFRGVPDSGYDFRTSLERSVFGAAVPQAALPAKTDPVRRAAIDVLYGGIARAGLPGPPAKSMAEVEAGLVRQFKRRCHHFLADTPDQDDWLEWIALMQHYGAPTRFLDWTYSLYVAVFFAVERSDRECAVWAVDATWLPDEATRIFDESPHGKDPLRSDNNPRTLTGFKAAFNMTPPLRFARPINPYRLNERLTIQQGSFLAQGDIGATFEENFEAILRRSAGKRLFKLTIPDDADLRRNILRQLNRMNVTRATLFPGLEGFAESLSTQLLIPQMLVADSGALP